MTRIYAPAANAGIWVVGVSRICEETTAPHPLLADEVAVACAALNNIDKLQTEICAAVAQIQAYSKRNSELTAERDKLQAFKEYAHDRLTLLGAPANPNPTGEHAKAGCRVGERFDWVEERFSKPSPQQDANERVEVTERVAAVILVHLNRNGMNVEEVHSVFKMAHAVVKECRGA